MDLIGLESGLKVSELLMGEVMAALWQKGMTTVVLK